MTTSAGRRRKITTVPMPDMPDPHDDAIGSIARLIPPGERVLQRLLQRQAERHGDRILLVAGTTSWTFSDAPRIAARRAAALAEAGVAPGDRVAILAGNRAEFLEVILG